MPRYEPIPRTIPSLNSHKIQNTLGRQIPIILDTPLGRLDSAHRKNLIERYFPDASHQVILLSTDTEIGLSEVQIMRENEAIAREYLLDYDSKQRCTTVKSGYFWSCLITTMIEPPVERIKLSQTAKDQLAKLKRATKIDQWNILCRWALCRSLAEPSIPTPVPIPADSNLEMSWQVFGGAIADQLLIALKQRCHNDGLETDNETLANQFRLHLHRGIGYLAGDPNLKSIEALIQLSLE